MTKDTVILSLVHGNILRDDTHFVVRIISTHVGKVSISRYLMKSQIKMKESTVFYLFRENLEHLLYRFLNRTTTPDSCFSFRMADYVKYEIHVRKENTYRNTYARE